MMAGLKLEFPDGMWSAIQQHLLPKRVRFEEAAFVYAAIEEEPRGTHLRAVEWYPVPPDGFEVQSRFFLQLTDETKAKVIKRAHDLNSALIEVHSHPFQARAQFSLSDLSGFEEFVPHVRWRLRQRPYAAVVVANGTFDAFEWSGDAKKPGALDSIVADGEQHFPTRLSQTDDGGPHGPGRSVQPE